MTVPAYDHIVVVMMENKNYGEIIGNSNAPYINSLATAGALLTNYDAVTHPSQGNYFALYSGSTFGVTDSNHHTEPDPTLATILQGAGKTFVGYVEHPNSSFDHNPWESFPEGVSVEQNFTAFPTTAVSNFAALPTVAFVSPNTDDDMHNGSIQAGDTWLQANIDAYAQWAKTHNSLLVVAFDENNDESGGTVDPSNRVVALLYGAGVTAGQYSTPYNHYDMLRTILASQSLTAPRNAGAATTIDVFGSQTSTPTVSWTPAAETGVEGGPIALGTIVPSLGTFVAAGSTLSLTSVLVSAVPVGATLSDGTHSFTASSGTTSVDVLGWNDAALTITPSNTTNFTLSVQAKNSSGVTSTAANEAVTVNPLAPTLVPQPGSAAVGQKIALNLGILANALAGDTSNSISSVTITDIPSGATLSNTNGDTLIVSGGSIAFSAAQLAAGALTGLAIKPTSAGGFLLTVSATEQDAEGDTTTARNIDALIATATAVPGGTISTSITGPFNLSANPLSITGTGTITSTGTVASTGAGKDGIDGSSATSWTVMNSGTVSSAQGYGVKLGGSGTINSGGLITSAAEAAIYLSAGGNVSNSGSIGGTGTIGQFAATGVFVKGAPGTIANGGTITGGAYGLELEAGGMVTNIGAIRGAEDAVRIHGTTGETGTLINSGSIIATVDDGAGFGVSGSISNASGGLIAGVGTTKGAGIYFDTASSVGTVTNSGSITGHNLGIALYSGGTVTNTTGARISGPKAVVIDYGLGLVTNSGSIAGTTSAAVRLKAGGSVTNAAGGSISGTLGVQIYGGTGTVTNNGTIFGTSHAVTFGGGGHNRLVAGATAVFIGDVVGSTATGSTDTLELAGSGTMSELAANTGTMLQNAHTWSFSNFASIVVDGGATWTMSDSNTVTTITDNGTLIVGDGAALTVTATASVVAGTIELDGGALTGNSGISFGAGTSNGTLSGFGTVTGALTRSGSGTADTIAASGGTLTLTTAIGGNSGLDFAVANSAVSILQLSVAPGAGNTFTFVGPAGGLSLTASAASGFADTVIGLNVGTTAVATNFIDVGANVSITSGQSGSGTSGTITLSDGAVLHLAGMQGHTGGIWFLNTVGDGNGGTEIFASTTCFAAGTRILTATGERLVETLLRGDIVLTLADGEVNAQPVKWLGRRRLDLTAHPRPETLAPIRIRRGAFADNLPHSDLLVSPDHAIFVDGRLICARQLINGTTIRQEEGWTSVEYFHVELDTHAILLAEGLPAESYLDTGGRGFFANSGEPLVLHPDLTDESDYPTRAAGSCEPFVTDEASVRPVWQRLSERAAVLGQPAPTVATTTDPSLHIVAAGRTIRPIYQDGKLCIFPLPRNASSVRLASRAGAPTETRPWLDDRRRLGVQVSRIVLRNASEVREIPVDHPDLRDGWWAVERDGIALRRWTDGAAALPLPAMDGPTMLELHLGGAMTYATESGKDRKAA